MTDKQPNALELADALDFPDTDELEQALELRRQYEEIEALQQDVKKFLEAASCERDVRLLLRNAVDTIKADEALLRQALELLEWEYGLSHHLVFAIKERLTGDSLSPNHTKES
jgi:hypothetical protein